MIQRGELHGHPRLCQAISQVKHVIFIICDLAHSVEVFLVLHDNHHFSELKQAFLVSGLHAHYWLLFPQPQLQLLLQSAAEKPPFD